MPVVPEHRRVLVGTTAAAEGSLRPLFEEGLPNWEVVTVDSFERARFVQQHNPCDLLLVDETLYQQEGAPGLAWLARQREMPVLLLSSATPQAVSTAYANGVHVWLPRDVTLEHPPLLAAALNRAVQLGDQGRSVRQALASLEESRRRVDRLVGLLWRAAPMDPETRWLTQRHVLERLQEEIVRSERHGAPLTVALGEVHSAHAEEAREELLLASWTTDRVTRIKRRCDVAGQYGLQGFLLLLVQTPPAGALTCCRRLRQALEETDATGQGPRGPIHAYFGLASFSARIDTPQRMLSIAERHLEEAKDRGTDRVVGG
jgi:GGDEF domain-containing protein